jgi:hypothetical protein
MTDNGPSRTRGRDDKVLPTANDGAESKKSPIAPSPSAQQGSPGNRPILHLKHAGEASRPPSQTGSQKTD